MKYAQENYTGNKRNVQLGAFNKKPEQLANPNKKQAPRFLLKNYLSMNYKEIKPGSVFQQITLLTLEAIESGNICQP